MGLLDGIRVGIREREIARRMLAAIPDEHRGELAHRLLTAMSIDIARMEFNAVHGRRPSRRPPRWLTI